jgi:hypothetical protein
MFKPKVKGKVTLFQCPKCRRKHNNPVTHVCKRGTASISLREKIEANAFHRMRGEPEPWTRPNGQPYR